jgi:hypothetical protein
MKVAHHPETKEPLTAAADVPQQAVCPYCQGIVLLRSRKQMSGACTYYWRHQDNRNRTCNGRSRPLDR